MGVDSNASCTQRAPGLSLWRDENGYKVIWTKLRACFLVHQNKGPFIPAALFPHCLVSLWKAFKGDRPGIPSDAKCGRQFELLLCPFWVTALRCTCWTLETKTRQTQETCNTFWPCGACQSCLNVPFNVFFFFCAEIFTVVKLRIHSARFMMHLFDFEWSHSIDPVASGCIGVLCSSPVAKIEFALYAAWLNNIGFVFRVEQ